MAAAAPPRTIQRENTLNLAPDPLARKFLDRYKDHSHTAYHNVDIDWTGDVVKKLERLTTHKRGKLPKDDLARSIDPKDETSPDSWVPRNPELVRLTGKHPLNAEPNSVDLYDQGFITPVSLHYVRNHGKVPRIKREDHRLTIGGLVQRPQSLTMDDLMTKFKTITMPITIVCSGNRRKELNMIEKTIGFNWTTSAHSCNMWTGVKLADVLEFCGVDMEKARYVWFDGAVCEDLPMGTYGTSIDVLTAINPFDHVLLAWEQNGIPLSPDHGFPLRVIVPGWVGGRAVKWLERIWVSDHGSENFYHFHDNRIMPPHVDSTLANEEGWWYREEYLFDQLNVNSAIIYPNHRETVHFPAKGNYTVRGYGYSGGGRKVNRVEISLDAGKTWSLCSLKYPEEKFGSAWKYGKYYCWMFWEFDVDLDLITKEAEKGGEIRCRAWDIANNTQPAVPTWNALGMGNNCQFIVKFKLIEEFGVKFIEFFHPVGEAGDTDGWMPPPKQKLERPLTQREKSAARNDVKFYTMEEVAKHNTEKSAWLVVDGSVYDATSYLKHHPGGAESIIMNSGIDASEDFHAVHTPAAFDLLEEFYIGELQKGEGSAITARNAASSPSKPVIPVVSLKSWTFFELIERVELNHDTKLFKYKLQSAEGSINIPVGHHIFLKATVDGKAVLRAYTPVSSEDNKGIFTLLIKVYFAGVNPYFPEGGKMSQYLNAMKVGDKINVKGPCGHFEYKGKGKVILSGTERTVGEIGLLCGGTGITPAYQVMKAVYQDPSDNTKIKLIYANRTEEDILLRSELDKMAAERQNIEVWHTLSTAPPGWKMGVGRMNKSMIEKHMPPADKNNVICMCGPPLMISDTCVPSLKELHYKEDNMVLF